MFPPLVLCRKISRVFSSMENWNSFTMCTITFQVEESLMQLFIYVGKDQMGQRLMVKIGKDWEGLRRSNLKIIENDRMGSFKNDVILKTFFPLVCSRCFLSFIHSKIVTSLICYN